MELSELRKIRMARLALNRKLLSLREVEGAEEERRAAVAELEALADREDVLVAGLGVDECSVACRLLI